MLLLISIVVTLNKIDANDIINNNNRVMTTKPFQARVDIPTWSELNFNESMMCNFVLFLRVMKKVRQL